MSGFNKLCRSLRFKFEHVVEQVIFSKLVGEFEQALILFGCAREREVVHRVFVGFEREVFQNVRRAFALHGLAVFPLFGIDDFFDARQGDGIEILVRLDEDVLAPSAVFTIQIDNRVRCRSRTGEEVKHYFLLLYSLIYKPFNKGSRLRISE